MKTLLRIAISTAILSALVGCAGNQNAKPVWMEASDANIPAYTTFGWANSPDSPPVAIIDRQIRDAIRSQLLAKGYQESSTAPEILVEHETFERDAVQQGNPVRIGIGLGSWGGNVGGSVGTSVDVGEKNKVVQQVQVNVRVLSEAEGREVWNGTSTPMQASPAANEVERVVIRLMREFPARAGTAGT